MGDGSSEHATGSADSRSAHAGIRLREGIARRRRSALRCRRQFHHRADAQSRTGNGSARREVAGIDLRLHDELDGQQDLPGHRPRCRHVWHRRSRRPRQARGHDQPSGALHAPGRRLCPEAYVPGTAAPFIVGADGPDPLLFTALDQSDPQKRVPLSSPSRSATAAATRRAASAASNTTRCRGATRSSSRRKCCRSSSANAT